MTKKGLIYLWCTLEVRWFYLFAFVQKQKDNLTQAFQNLFEVVQALTLFLKSSHTFVLIFKFTLTFLF